MFANSHDAELDDLNKELKNAGLEPLGDVPKEDENNSSDHADEAAGTEVVPKEEEADESKTDIDADDESEESDEDDESEDDSEEEGDSDDEEDEDDEENGDAAARNGASRENINIPYSQYKDETKALKEQRDYWQRVAEGKTGKPAAETKVEDPMEIAVNKLSTELKLNPQQSKLFLETVLDLAAKRAIPADLMDRLGKLEEREKKQDVREMKQAEESYFRGEWNKFLPALKKEYPNATDQQVAEAYQAMDIIAHAPRFAKIPDLEYIFQKTRADFAGILFSPKKKGLEQGRRAIDTEQREFTPPGMGEETPKGMQALEESLFGENEDGLQFFDEEGNPMRR